MSAAPVTYTETCTKTLGYWNYTETSYLPPGSEGENKTIIMHN